MADPDVKTDGPALSPREEPADIGPEPSPRGCSGCSWKAALVLVIVLGALLAMLFPAIQAAREAARRAQCRNNLMQIGLAIRNYAQVLQTVFPPGTVCDGRPKAPGNQYDVLAEAARGEPGNCAAGFLLRIMPYIGGNIIRWNWIAWNWNVGISNSSTNLGPPYAPNCNLNLAMTDIAGFYCPSRRSGLRAEDRAMMLSPAWTGGGTDYGGCVGRHAAFSKATGYNICDATMYYEPNFYPSLFKAKADEVESRRWGIFGRVNVSTRYDEIRDGLSNTIMTGELQRIADLTPGSKDGWAIGGAASLFTTGAMARPSDSTFEFVASPAEGKLMNNGFWGSPGSVHPNGANFGFADGSVNFVNQMADPSIFALLGSMADGEPAQL